MTGLNRATRRRLQQLPQFPNVWEGDRRALGFAKGLTADTQGDCILWVDGTQGMVRAMDIVPGDAGPEAIVRALLQAMELPQGSSQPGRPLKIVVRDREIQFFLRGVLQQLEIEIDYTAELPLIDEIFRGLSSAIGHHPPELPPAYEKILVKKAFQIWEDGPWHWLSDHQILAVTLNQWDIDTLYVSILGMLGEEYGILLYRSLDSLRRFRQRALAEESLEQLEQAFLDQDCLFLSFEPDEDQVDPEDIVDLEDLPLDALRPTFGNLHPLEGLRSFLHEEEAMVVFVVLSALHRFFAQHQPRFGLEEFPPLQSRYRVTLPAGGQEQKQLSIKVETLPDLAAELLEMAHPDEIPSLEEALNLLAESGPLVRDDLIPKDSYFSLGAMPWPTIEALRLGISSHQGGEATTAGDGLPIVLIQTTRPKAKALIQKLEEAGGVKGIGFNPGEDPFSSDRFDLGILQTQDDQLHLFGEFNAADSVHQSARKKWDQRCKKTKGWCGLIVAGGSTGASRGNPQVRDMMALFEVPALSEADLGLGTLQLVSQLG
jgi:hypothetical protein